MAEVLEHVELCELEAGLDCVNGIYYVQYWTVLCSVLYCVNGILCSVLYCVNGIYYVQYWTMSIVYFFRYWTESD